MPIKTIRFKCSKCGAIFDNETSAKYCEDTHVSAKQIQSEEYSLRKSVPIKLKVFCENGKIYEYVLKE